VPAGRDGDRYWLSGEQVATFRSDGYVHLKGLLSEAEVEALAPTFDRFLRGEIEVAGKDFCDMSGDYSRSRESYSILNVMLPGKYHPAWRGNVYERRAAHVAEQLCGAGMALDYDQLLAKRPFKEDAVFHWHQDLAYWPITEDTRTASFWLAVDAATVENGCVRFVVGSHAEPELRPHEPLLGDRGKSHTLVARVDETRDRIRPAELARGDATVHHERVVHGSFGNRTASWRRAYVMAFRSRETVAQERAMGFTHSHNDDPAVLARVGRALGR
jgi:ectoine hydroxylase-related dioxygenase (phytanoyl-CoA dioxygenase family)